MKKFILILLSILCFSCSPIRVYKFGENLNFLTIKVGTKYQIQEEYKKITGGSSSKGMVGFYHISAHTIYTIEDFNILLHELYHAGGNLGEPPWETYGSN